jgi:hypothetical protein
VRAEVISEALSEPVQNSDFLAVNKGRRGRLAALEYILAHNDDQYFVHALSPRPQTYGEKQSATEWMNSKIENFRRRLFGVIAANVILSFTAVLVDHSPFYIIYFSGAQREYFTFQSFIRS